MMTAPPVPARVVPFERSFLFAVALKHGGIHVQGVALRAYRQSLHLPLGHRIEEALNLAHAELPEQIADRVVGGETLHAQQRMQRLVAAQQTGVSEALGAYQHGHQERHPRGRWLNVVRRIPLDGEVTANLLRQTNLLQIRDEDRDPTEGGHRSLGLTQNHPLAREQSSDFLRNRFVRGVCFHSPLSQAFTLRVQFSFGIQDNSVTDPTLLALVSLADRDKHGYAIMEDIQRFAGVRLGPGTLYGAISRLQERGWIRPVASGDRRRPYAITGAGKQYLEEQLARLDQVVKTAMRRLRPA